MGQKPIPYPKTQTKLVFYVNSPFHQHPNKFFQRFKKKSFIQFEITEK
jgi:hypothetical protein